MKFHFSVFVKHNIRKVNVDLIFFRFENRNVKFGLVFIIALKGLKKFTLQKK